MFSENDPVFYNAMQRASTHYNEIVCSDIYSYNCINFMTGLSYTSLIKAFRAIRTSGTVRMHMLPDVVWIGNDRAMNPFMTFLGTLFLP